MHIRLVAPAQAAMIVDQNLIALGKLRHLRHAPGRQANAGAGDQDQWVARAGEVIIQIDVVHFDFAALNRLELFQTPSEDCLPRAGCGPAYLCRDATESPSQCHYNAPVCVTLRLDTNLFTAITESLITP